MADEKKQEPMGIVRRFETKDKIHFSFYSFEPESKIFQIRRSAAFEKFCDNETFFTSVESVKTKNFLSGFLHICFLIRADNGNL